MHRNLESAACVLFLVLDPHTWNHTGVAVCDQLLSLDMSVTGVFFYLVCLQDPPPRDLVRLGRYNKQLLLGDSSAAEICLFIEAVNLVTQADHKLLGSLPFHYTSRSYGC